MRRYVVQVAGAIAAVALVGLNTPSANALVQRPAGRYYVAVGDSISYGFQTAKALAGDPPSAFDTGYVDYVAAHLRGRPQFPHVVNFACPGETSASITSPCVWKATGHQLHQDYSGAQLDAVLGFLREHRGRVDPITVSMGGNDIDEFLATCPPGDIGCIQAGAPAAIAAFTGRMGSILSQLRQAAPHSRIVMVGLYDPDVPALELADPLFAQVNGALAAVSAAYGAGFADVMARFNPPQDEVATVCRLTLVCADGDSHPTDAGYVVMGQVVLGALRRCA